MFSCTKGIWTQLATAQCDEGSEGKCEMFASFVYQAPMNNLRLIRCVDINCMARGLSCVSESARSIGREGLSKASNSAWHQLVTWERCDTCSSHSRVTAHEKRHSDPPRSRHTPEAQSGLQRSSHDNSKTSTTKRQQQSPCCLFSR